MPKKKRRKSYSEISNSYWFFLALYVSTFVWKLSFLSSHKVLFTQRISWWIYCYQSNASSLDFLLKIVILDKNLINLFYLYTTLQNTAFKGPQEGCAGFNNQHNIHLVYGACRGSNSIPLERESSALTTRSWILAFCCTYL